MGPYYATFFISILLCAGGELKLLKNRFCSALLIVLSVIPPVILAGARDYSIGKDIETYGNYVFQTARNCNTLSAMLFQHRDIETLYKVMAFYVSRYTNNAHWFYLVTELIICICTMAGLWYYRKWCSMTLGWACFLFLFYGDTLNTMRQCLAVAIVFAAFPLFLEKKYILFALLQIIAIEFHVTGAIALCVPVLYLIFKYKPPRWMQLYFVIIFICIIQSYSPLLKIILQWELLPAKFSRYLAQGSAFALNPTLLRLPFLIPIIYYYDRFCGTERMTLPAGLQRGSVRSDPGTSVSAAAAQGIMTPGATNSETATSAAMAPAAMAPEAGEREPAEGMLYVFLLLLEICAVQLRSVRPALYRISFYFGHYRFIAYPRLVRILRRDNRMLVAAALLFYLCVLWYYQNVMQGNNQIYPYIYTPDWFAQNIYAMPAP